MSLDFTIVALVMINNFHFPPLERPAKIARLVAQQTVIIPMQIPNANRTHCVKCRGHWQLIVLCPKNNVVVWFCSLRRKLDVHIKVAIDKLCNSF